MAPGSTRRGVGVRAILAAGLVTIMAAVMPATAAAPAPNLLQSTVDSGWNLSTTQIAARFNGSLAATSTATIQQNGVDVAGWTSSVQSTVLTMSGPALLADGTVYTIAFAVTGTQQDAGSATYGPFAFQVDPNGPYTPRITGPDALVDEEFQLFGENGVAPVRVDVGVADPTAPASEITGVAQDFAPDGDVSATSGIAKIELRFYDGIRQAAGLPAAVLSGRPDNFAFNFFASVPAAADVEWSVDLAEVEDLSSGIWTVRAIAYDSAGNVSSPSRPLTLAVE
jgi:hypothetical protein